MLTGKASPATSHFPHQHANVEQPDGKRVNVIYLFTEKHKVVLLFNWFGDLWNFYCKCKGVFIGNATAAPAVAPPNNGRVMFPVTSLRPVSILLFP